MNWSNYDDVMAQMQSIGLVVDSLDVGRLRRCKVEGEKERKGWYSLHELTLDGGDCVLVGSFGIWQGPNQNANKVELKRSALSDDQRAALKARIAADLRREVWPLLASGRIAPVIDRVFPLEEAAAAHARMESSAHIGKIVLGLD